MGNVPSEYGLGGVIEGLRQGAYLLLRKQESMCQPPASSRPATGWRKIVHGWSSKELASRGRRWELDQGRHMANSPKDGRDSRRRIVLCGPMVRESVGQVDYSLKWLDSNAEGWRSSENSRCFDSFSRAGLEPGILGINGIGLSSAALPTLERR